MAEYRPDTTTRFKYEQRGDVPKGEQDVRVPVQWVRNRFDQKAPPRLTRRKDGTISYSHADLYTGDWSAGSRPFVMTNPKARVEISEKFIERVTKSIEQSNCASQSRSNNKWIGVVMTGVDGHKWRMTATDGHRALLTKAAADCAVSGELKLNVSEGVWKDVNRQSAVIVNSEFHNTIKRAKLMADERSKLVRLTFDPYMYGSIGSVTVQSSHTSGAKNVHDIGEFDESLECESSGKLTAGFNADYVLDLCGVWPLKVWWKDAKSHIVFGDQADTFRVALMPMRI